MGLPDLGYNQRSSLEIGGQGLENPTLLLTPTPTPPPQLEAPVLDVLGTLPRNDGYLSVLVFSLLLS